MFIDELHTVKKLARLGAMDAANILKPMLARGELHMIGRPSTSTASILKRMLLERRFQPVSSVNRG